MSDIAIRCEGLAKRYEIGEREAYKTIRDVITDAVAAPFRRLRSAAQHSSNGNGSQNKPTIWALKDVSFEIKRGEVVGIIGRNGAGKSTLLKILSRITEPTRGSVDVWGRVGSLLEVGTGFHPELTGRDNIFLNGAILGMKKTEIARKFDEIVAFAEVEKFIDTPVKRYSSGMYVRLAFAVAAHMQPAILLVDEVLAVGDIAFQRKCLGKMGNVARQGRTVVFVSHNMAAINALCSRCVILNAGEVEFDGPTKSATERYYAESLRMVSSSDLSASARDGTGKARFTSIHVQPLDAEGQELEVAYPGCDLSIGIQLRCESTFDHATVALVFYDSNGYRIIDANTAQKGEFVSMTAGQSAEIGFLLRQVLLTPGKYFIGLWLGREGSEILDEIEHAILLDVAEGQESSKHHLIYPGIYLCRFEQTISVSEPISTWAAPA
jgi:lipopolysaccharide transport system ATP-binding protein